MFSVFFPPSAHFENFMNQRFFFGFRPLPVNILPSAQKTCCKCLLPPPTNAAIISGQSNNATGAEN